MADVPLSTDRSPRSRRLSLVPNMFERLLAFGAAVLFVVVIAALLRGRSQWPTVPVIVWLHLGTIIVALALTPVLLLQSRGVRRHRLLGYAWVAAMMSTAALSFAVRNGTGHLSVIHLLSALTLIMAPALAWFAHSHRVRPHRATAVSLVAGALLIAGFFTFPFGRLLGRWLLG